MHSDRLPSTSYTHTLLAGRVAWRHAPLRDGHEFLRRGGVDGHAVVEVGFGCAHLQCHAEALQHFVRRLTFNNTHTDNNHIFLVDFMS